MSVLTLASAGAQGYGTKQQNPVPCDCSNCSAEHCPKPKGSKSFPKQITIESWSFGSGSAKGATGLRSNQK